MLSIPTDSFNSIKVQLEHDCVSTKIQVPWFQFHKGAIRTVSFHLLRLVLTLVSIP